MKGTRCTLCKMQAFAPEVCVLLHCKRTWAARTPVCYLARTPTTQADAAAKEAEWNSSTTPTRAPTRRPCAAS